MKWEAKQHGPDWVVVADDGSMINVGDALYHSENKAKSQLIAAAPDMLDACMEVVECIKLRGIADHQIDIMKVAARKCEAAIAKATGG